MRVGDEAGVSLFLSNFSSIISYVSQIIARFFLLILFFFPAPPSSLLHFPDTQLQNLEKEYSHLEARHAKIGMFSELALPYLNVFHDLYKWLFFLSYYSLYLLDRSQVEGAGRGEPTFGADHRRHGYAFQVGFIQYASIVNVYISFTRFAEGELQEQKAANMQIRAFTSSDFILWPSLL